MKYVEKQVNRLTGQAIHRYDLLHDGDRILVAVSGGADSLVMFHLLREWQRKAPIRFSLLPCFLNMGFRHGDYWLPLREYLHESGIGFYWEGTDYGPFAHSRKNRKKSPCFFCAMRRRQRLFEIAHRFSCNKIALGHNLDDIIETFFINVCYSGEMSTMVPKQEMFQGLLTIIRPLALVEKSQVNRLSSLLKLPVIKNPCPSAGTSSRAEIRELLKTLYGKNRKIKGNIRRALSHVRPEYLL